jgi:hypothetical protein
VIRSPGNRCVADWTIERERLSASTVGGAAGSDPCELESFDLSSDGSGPR